MEEKGIISRITESVSSAGGAIKNAVGVAREMQSMVTDYQVKEKTTELLDKLLDVQQQQFGLSDLLNSSKEKIIQLEDEKKQYENWESESEYYELFQPMPGTIVYRIKPSDEPNHIAIYLCASCYQKRKKSIIQFSATPTVAGRAVVMKCHDCNALYQFPIHVLKGENQ